MARPSLAGGTGSSPMLGVRMTVEDLAALDRLAARWGRRRSEIVRDLVADAVRREEDRATA